jgi:hypothetical protein
MPMTLFIMTARRLRFMYSTMNMLCQNLTGRNDGGINDEAVCKAPIDAHKEQAVT